MGLVVGALVGHPVLGPEPAHQLAGLAQPGEALLLVGPADADGNLVHRLAGADAEEDPAGVEAAEGGGGVGDDRRVVAQRGGDHARPQPDPAGALTQGAEPGEGEGSVAAGVPPRLEVIADDHRVEADLLGEDAEVEELSWSELFGGRLVAEGEHDSLRRGVAAGGRPPARGRVSARIKYADATPEMMADGSSAQQAAHGERGRVAPGGAAWTSISASPVAQSRRGSRVLELGPARRVGTEGDAAAEEEDADVVGGRHPHRPGHPRLAEVLEQLGHPDERGVHPPEAGGEVDEPGSATATSGR